MFPTFLIPAQLTISFSCPACLISSFRIQSLPKNLRAFPSQDASERAVKKNCSCSLTFRLALANLSLFPESISSSLALKVDMHTAGAGVLSHGERQLCLGINCVRNVATVKLAHWVASRS